MDAGVAKTLTHIDNFFHFMAGGVVSYILSADLLFKEATLLLYFS